MTPESVSKSKEKLTTVCQKIIKNLNLNNFSVIFASQISRLPSFIEILNSLPAMENPYLRQEVADVLWLSQHENLVAKLGWSLDSKPNSKGHDERFFDLEIQKFLDKPVQFIHLEAGRTFDALKPKASPYIAVEGENRILLKSGEKVSEKIGVANKEALMHLSKIVSLFEKLFGVIETDSLSAKNPVYYRQNNAMIKINMDKIEELLTRGVAQIIPTKEDLEKELRSGKKLRLYTGIDPTGSQVHIGHTAWMWKLRAFQDLGHEVIVLIGDFTGMIGDPSGKSDARKILTKEEVDKNAETYKEQIGKIIRFDGPNAAIIRRNSEWHSQMSALETARNMSYLTFAQVMEREHV